MSLKLLAVSDQVVDRIYSPQIRDAFPGVDVIAGCGDLPYTYLEFMVSMLDVPLVYVPGNHDPLYLSRDIRTQAQGGQCGDLESVVIKGTIFAGLGGSVMYRPDGVNQYTQSFMYLRALRLSTELVLNRLRFGRAVDVLLTHSPPFGIHDDDDLAHNGLNAINWVIRAFQPRYVLHGHTHFYRRNLQPYTTQMGQTLIINVFPYQIIEVSNHA